MIAIVILSRFFFFHFVSYSYFEMRCKTCFSILLFLVCIFFGVIVPDMFEMSGLYIYQTY